MRPTAAICGAGQLLRLDLARERLARRRRVTLSARRAPNRGDELERPRRRRPVVLGEPQRKIDERWRDGVEHATDGDGTDPGWGLDAHVDDDSAYLLSPEPDRDDGAFPDIVGDLVRERASERARRDEWVDLGEHLRRG